MRQDDELQLAAKLAANHVDAMDSLGIIQENDPTVLREHLVKELQDEGIVAEQVISELHRDASPGIMNTGSGRFFGFVIGGALPVTIATEFLVAAWDQNAGAYFASPSAAIVEEVAGAWLKDLLNLPTEVSFAFVTGCQTAHLVGLAAARHYLLSKNKGWNVEQDGLFGAPRIRVIVGEHHHETLIRAMRFLGLGAKALVQVESCPESGTINVDSLQQELDKDPDCCTIVALAAGDLNRGNFDPFEQVCEIAHARGAWVHVDGAFGLWAAASPKFQHLTKGMELADSWATDAHKILNVPQDSGIVFCRHDEAHKASMSIYAPYAVEHDSTHVVRDQYQWGPDWSRRGRGFAVYAALRHLGRKGVGQLVEQYCDLAAALVESLGELEGVEVLSKPVFNQGLVRFLDPNNGNHDEYTDKVVDKINESGEVWFGATSWREMRVMRISVCSHRTTEKDIDRAVQIIKRALASAENGKM